MYSSPQLPRLIYCTRRPRNSLIIYKYKPREEIALLIDFCDANLRLTGFKHCPATVLVPHTLTKKQQATQCRCLRSVTLAFVTRHSPPSVLLRNLEGEETRKRDKELGTDSTILEESPDILQVKARLCGTVPGHAGPCRVVWGVARLPTPAQMAAKLD